MALQLALTTLESVAVMLNERKRESEQSAAFHAKLRTSKLGKTDQARVLLREDDVHQLEFNNQGQVCRSKPRRLLLLNDQVVLAAVSGRVSEVRPIIDQSESSIHCIHDNGPITKHNFLYQPIIIDQSDLSIHCINRSK